MSDQGGYGFEPWGDPYGIGGPLHVRRARAVESQVVRVVFDEPPLTRSASGTNDALNPLNYSVSIIDGAGTKPQVVGVSPVPIPAPAVAVYAFPETGIDVHVDRPLVVGILYKITVVNVLAKAGGALSSEDNADFVGNFVLDKVNPPSRALQFSDFKFDLFSATGGAYVFSDTGDIAIDDGLENVRKRILRRIATPKGAFRHLPDYGTTLRLKRPLATRELVPLKADVLQQVKQEPEVIDAQVLVTLDPAHGLLLLQVRAKTIKGLVDTGVARTDEGQIVIT